MAAQRPLSSAAWGALPRWSRRCRSRLRNPFRLNSPRLTASSNSLSSPNRRRPRTGLPFQVVGRSKSLVNSSNRRLSSTLAKASAYRSAAFCDTSARRTRFPSRPFRRSPAPPVQIRYPPPHRPPVQRSIRLPFFGTIAPKRTHLVDRGLDPSKAAYLGVSFVVHLQRIPIDVVFDADA